MEKYLVMLYLVIKIIVAICFCSWGKRAAHNRAQIVYYMAENLELRHNEFSQRLCDMTGCSLEEAKEEVDTTIQRLFYWGAYADKYGGTVQVSSKSDGWHTQEITHRVHTLLLSFLVMLVTCPVGICTVF